MNDAHGYRQTFLIHTLASPCFEHDISSRFAECQVASLHPPDANPSPTFDCEGAHQVTWQGDNSFLSENECFKRWRAHLNRKVAKWQNWVTYI
jgi:hypothetical protein